LQVAKLEVLRTELAEAQAECEALSRQQEAPSSSVTEEDELDAFMNNLKTEKPNKDKVAQRAAKVCFL
jgi:hypothetical protein